MHMRLVFSIRKNHREVFLLEANRTISGMVGKNLLSIMWSISNRMVQEALTNANLVRKALKLETCLRI